MLTIKFVSVKLCVLMLLSACQTVTYTASCRVGDTACQRNQDAQTLALIGHKEAATELMCSDSSFSKSSICTGTSAVR